MAALLATLLQYLCKMVHQLCVLWDRVLNLAQRMLAWMMLKAVRLPRNVPWASKHPMDPE